jgi:hypothetical protein
MLDAQLKEMIEDVSIQQNLLNLEQRKSLEQ